MNRGIDPYIARRKKEELSFLIVRFLRAYVLFDEIYRDFQELAAGPHGFQGSGLFRRVRDLEEKLVFDIKEKAHFLFRSSQAEPAGDEVELKYADLQRHLLRREGAGGGDEARQILTELRKSLVDRSIDSYVGAGFHLFMILRESLYQLEFYAPRYGQELEQAERIEYLARRVGLDLSEEEAHELEHIRQIVKHGQAVAAYTRDLAERALERCRSLFKETAEILRHLIEESGANEVLVLNVLSQRQLVERVFGPGSAEEILAHMFRNSDLPGATGMEKGLAFVRERCGNTEALEAGGCR